MVYLPAFSTVTLEKVMSPPFILTYLPPEAAVLEATAASLVMVASSASYGAAKAVQATERPHARKTFLKSMFSP